MKILISNFLLLRVPQFSYEANLSIVWEDLKRSIALSSASFYEVVREADYRDYMLMDPKTKFTIWKYFNRSKYRGVPYGSFAGFGVASLAIGDTGSHEIQISDQQYLHRFPDWSQKNNLKIRYVSAFDERLIFANGSTYIVGDNIRFLCFNDGVFEISEIERNETIEKLLARCNRPVAYKDLLSFADVSLTDIEEFNDFLQDLLNLQLLFTDLDPNSIGTDYFKRIEMPPEHQEKLYYIAERKVKEGCIAAGIFKSFPACIQYLLNISSGQTNNGLFKFKIAFTKKFEDQEIGLLQALDPELGVGYQDLESGANQDLLIAGLVKNKGGEPLNFTEHKIKSDLLNSIINGKGDKEHIVFLEKGSFEGPEIKPSNTFSGLVSIADDLVILDQLGGCTSNALAGRFTLASNAVETHCKTMTDLESAANPDIIFFDLAYMAEDKVDNINRRKSLYQYEMPFLNYSYQDGLIAMNDLVVKVRQSEVILMSKRYNKRVIPRLSTAYNYSRSDLSIYRFLCDLQHQGIQSNLTFNIEQIIPGLKFYPRVQYNNIVLSAAKWHIAGGSVRDQLKEQKVSRYFKAGNGDQTLCFDQHNDEDMKAFDTYARQYQDFFVQEVILPQDSLVKDEQGRPYLSQMLITFSHGEPLYKPFSPKDISCKKDNVKQIITPGKEWLYFEIYCHSQRANPVLSDKIFTFVNSYREAFSCWFFIRYNEPSAHIRLRLRLKDERFGYFYIAELMELLQNETAGGLISDVQLKTYKRELERYGEDIIEYVEKHFQLSSNYALHILQQAWGANQIYSSCLDLLSQMLDGLALDSKSKLSLIKGLQDSLISEHDLKNGELKKINKEYNDFLKLYQPIQSVQDLCKENSEIVESFKRLLQKSKHERDLRLFADIFHMHVNRLFPDHQRTHELVLYSFFHKQLMRESRKV